jgi:hypothetical protein
MLASNGFTPEGIIFPVSALVLQRKREYDEALESFSISLMRLIDYEEDEVGVITVKNETTHFYPYFDATLMAEALYGGSRGPFAMSFEGSSNSSLASVI